MQSQKNKAMKHKAGIHFKPIGIIRTPFKSKEGMPIQSGAAAGIKGTIVLDEQYVEGISDLDGFTYIYLVYFFHQSDGFNLKVIPFLDDKPRGLFSTRAPRRPNQIGISVVKVLAVKDNKIEIEQVDMLDGTPLLDIKPYIPEFDARTQGKTGWIARQVDNLNKTRSDRRFD